MDYRMHDISIYDWDGDGTLLGEGGEYPQSVLDRWETVKEKAAIAAFSLPEDSVIHFYTGRPPAYLGDAESLDSVGGDDAFLKAIGDVWSKEWNKSPIKYKKYDPYRAARQQTRSEFRAPRSRRF